MEKFIKFIFVFYVYINKFAVYDHPFLLAHMEKIKKTNKTRSKL